MKNGIPFLNLPIDHGVLSVTTTQGKAFIDFRTDGEEDSIPELNKEQAVKLAIALLRYVDYPTQRVVCADNRKFLELDLEDGTVPLTIGKEYEIVWMTDRSEHYYIKDDEGVVEGYDYTRFRKVAN